MKHPTAHGILAVALCCHMMIANGAAPAIGTMLSSGTFRVDHATVTGNATLFEGATLETAVAGSSIQLNNGTRVSLEAGSRGRVFGDHLVLEQGTSRIERMAGFKLVALGLTIEPDRGLSTGGVQFEGSRRLRVVSSTGVLRVLTASGLVVANLSAGTALAFEPQQAAANVTRISGVLESKAGHYLITDEVTSVTIEVTGPALDKIVGTRIEVLGTMDPAATPAAEATQVIRARTIHALPKTPATAAAGKGGVAGAGAAHGIALGTIAIIGGVAVAATVGGLAATGALPGEGSSTPASR